ncbi:Aldo/keto reductase [Mycena galericulata]|nr:Aldo/keto reductase [Mycena galericulata]
MNAPKIPNSFPLNTFDSDGTQRKIPSVGLGCFMNSKTFTDKQVYDMCQKAIKAGYRHFDTVRNETQVGKAIRDAISSGIPREDFFITTKLANSDHDRVLDAFNESLARLDLQYIDLYLLHWPQASKRAVDFSQINASNMTVPPGESPTFVETWKAMENLGKKVRSIGVSNFSVKTLEELLSNCKIVPAVNQVELHPCLPQDDLMEYCKAKGMLLTAYSPLGRSKTFFAEQPVISRLAEKYKTTPPQIVLSWAVQRGTVIVPKSENEARLLANITYQLTELAQEDMERIAALHLEPGMHKSLLEFHSDDGGVFGWKYEWLGWNMIKGGTVPQ